MNTIEKNMPCWYELGWNKETKSLILRVHKKFAKEANGFSSDDLIVWSYKREFNLLSYSDFSGDYFGFDNAFRKCGEKGEFVEYEIKIPNLGTKVRCDYYSGVGKNSFDEPCPICKGEKNKISYDFRPAFAISASFTIFFKLAYFGRNMGISSKQFQLFEIETVAERNSVGNGSAVNGWFSEKLTKWLLYLKDNPVLLNDIILAMKTANSQMISGANGIFESLQFDADVGKKGRLILRCPGDASGIYPLSNDQGKEDYIFGSCNMDSPVQQITILAGLGALHDEARKAGV